MMFGLYRWTSSRMIALAFFDDLSRQPVELCVRGKVSQLLNDRLAHVILSKVR